MSNLATKRLLSEYRQLMAKPEPDFVAAPADMNDLFVWHFTIKGPRDTAFEGGIFHGKIVFPSGYPNEPPDIYFMTPNGRFETNKRLCLSFTSYHPESWTTAWGVQTILTSVIAFMPTRADGAIGGLDSTDAERRKYAIESRKWHCKECNLELEPDPIPEEKKEGEEKKPEEEKPKEEEEKGEKPKEEVKQEEEEPKKEEEKPVIDPEEEKRRRDEKAKATILNFMKEVSGANIEQEEAEGEQQPVVEEEKPKEENKEPQDVVDFADLASDDEEKLEKPQPEVKDEGKIEADAEEHPEEEMVPEKLDNEEPIEVDNCIDFEKLKEGKLNTKKQFYPLLDVPIIIVFLFLCFLIFNTYFSFVKIF